MENNIKKIVLVLIIFSTTMILSWVLPEIYKTATEKAPDYPISFYSSVADKFYSFIISDNGYIRTDLEGNIYTQQEFDSLFDDLMLQRQYKTYTTP